jgi:hypothetical protein
LFENFITSQGGSLSFVGTLKDGAGNAVVNKYDGNRPASFSPPTTWVSAPAGTFQVDIANTATTLLVPGAYDGVTRLTDAGATPDAFYFTLTIAPGPGGLPHEPTATAITRLVVEAELIDRDSALLLLCGKGVTADGSNRFLTGAIGYSLTLLGVTPAIPGVVSDADLSLVAPAMFYVLCDLAEYRLLKNLLGSFAQPDQTAGNTKILLNKMIDRFHKQMLDLEKQYASYLGRYRAVLSTGSLRVVRPGPSDPASSSRFDRPDF